MFPKALIGQTHLGSYLCASWELRVTGRCLESDLNVPSDSAFSDLESLEIIKALKKDRADRTIDTRQVSPLSCGVPIWVLSRGNDHRGATWHDQEHGVVWLLSAGRHRSGEPNDFFPQVKALSTEQLMPGRSDYERLFLDRDKRFAHSIRIEGPLILEEARRTRKEQRVMLGGAHGACIAVECADDVEAITVAFRISTVEFDHVPIILQAIHHGQWDPVAQMPSRILAADEFAFSLMHESSLGESDA